jgi:hypothetical protein
MGPSRRLGAFAPEWVPSRRSGRIGSFTPTGCLHAGQVGMGPFWRFPAVRKKAEKDLKKKKKNTRRKMEVKNGFSGSERKKKTRGKKAERGRKLRGKKKKAAERERIEKGKRKKERERKYGCLINEEGIVNVKYERILFILLSFWLK